MRGRSHAARVRSGHHTVFDLANNYGPPDGSAEETFGRILRESLGKWRDEMVITTKAGYYMWAGSVWGMGVAEYICCRRSTSRAQTDGNSACGHLLFAPARIRIHRSKKQWGHWRMRCRAAQGDLCGTFQLRCRKTRARAAKLLRELGTPCLIHQPRYSMLDRWVEPQLLSDAGGRGHRLHGIFAIGEGGFDGPLFQGHPGGFAGRA